MKILNLTQHSLTASQIEAGCFEPEEADKERLKVLLTFEELPTMFDFTCNAIEIAGIARKYKCEDVMIGGHLDFMIYLIVRLRASGMRPRSSFTKRNIVEVHNPDGTVTKTQMFQHAGWTFPMEF